MNFAARILRGLKEVLADVRGENTDVRKTDFLVVDGHPLTQNELIILRIISRLWPNAYGFTVYRETEMSIGSVYAVFDSLERKGMVVSRQGEATKERGGRRKMYVDLTVAGMKTLNPVQ